jgi:glycosyltransferase involved in cell wall biosynthesis
VTRLGEIFSVAVLVPAFNEQRTIEAVVTGALPHVDSVLVVDDGSTDGTAEAARRAGAEVISHARNLGKGCAVRTGLERILTRGHTHVLLMDGDLQHLPADIPRLLDAAASTGGSPPGDARIDLVIGERVFDRSRMPASRYYSNVIGSRALSWLIGTRIRDSQSGFRLVRCDALRGLALESTAYEIETEMLIKLVRRGRRVGRVSVSVSYDGGPSKLRPIRDTTRTCFLAVYYRYLAG